MKKKPRILEEGVSCLTMYWIEEKRVGITLREKLVKSILEVKRLSDRRYLRGCTILGTRRR